jgi:hypothetical protein
MSGCLQVGRENENCSVVFFRIQPRAAHITPTGVKQFPASPQKIAPQGGAILIVVSAQV